MQDIPEVLTRPQQKLPAQASASPSNTGLDGYTANRVPTLQEIVEEIERLMHLARQQGYVITVALRPLKPLAMGHHEQAIEIRPRRGV